MSQGLMTMERDPAPAAVFSPDRRYRYTLLVLSPESY